MKEHQQTGRKKLDGNKKISGKRLGKNCKDAQDDLASPGMR